MKKGTAINRAYYEAASDGREDYWRLMAAPRRRVEVIAREIGNVTEAESAVDLGCGNGQLLREVARYYPRLRLAGVDLSTRQIEENRAAWPSVDWLAADLQADVSRLPAARFDIVIATEVIEHLDEPGKLLESARRLVTEGGRFILSTQSGRVGETERRVGHLRHFSATELTRLLESHGWRAERVWNEGFPFHDLSKWVANRNPDRSMAAFGTGTYGVTQRLACAVLRLAFRFNSTRRGAQLFAVAGPA